jgi:hypothetical protein
VPIDAVGDALADLPIDTAEIEELLEALERAGRRVIVPTGATGVAALRKVIPQARALASAKGRKPTVEELAAATGLSQSEVRHALLLARVMGR